MPIKITMPALSPTMEEGTLAKWLKSEGDVIESGDVIAEIETDKATMEVEAVDEGILGKIIIQAGSEHVKVNQIIAILLEEGETIDNIDIEGLNTPVKSPPIQIQDQTAKTEETTSSAAPSKILPPQSNQSRVFATPLARRLAKEKGIDLAQISGTGPKGRIVKSDILNLKTGAQSPSPNSSPSPTPQMSSGPDAKQLSDMLSMEYTEIPNSNVRKIVARRLVESKQTVPHFYLTIECQIDTLMKARKEINEAANGAYKLSVNDFIIKSVAQALKAYPAANVAWTDSAILQYKHADISVAVATPNGLITPIVKAAETKGLQEISAEIKDLAGRAREGKLKPEEFQGGTFSVSNLGMYGIKEFDAIINPPQACILAVGAGTKQPYVDGHEVKIGTFMNCTLSVDHRAVDGAVGAEFLQYFKRFIENPVNMLV